VRHGALPNRYVPCRQASRCSSWPRLRARGQYLLLLLGQDLEPVSVGVYRYNVSVAARFDSGLTS